MKTGFRYTIALTLILFCQLSWAGDLTIPHVFVSGTPALASEVNENFSEVELEVDDNSVRIDDLNTTLSSKLNTTGGTVTGDLDVQGNITADNFVFHEPRTHVISIPSEAFTSSLGNPVSTSWGSGGAYPTVSGADAMVAPVILPEGAVITDVDFYYVDNSAPSDLTINLAYRSLTIGIAATAADFTSSGASGNNNDVQTASLTNLNANIRSDINSYYIRAYCADWPGNSSLRIHAVRITYTTDEVL